MRRVPECAHGRAERKEYLEIPFVLAGWRANTYGLADRSITTKVMIVHPTEEPPVRLHPRCDQINKYMKNITSALVVMAAYIAGNKKWLHESCHIPEPLPLSRCRYTYVSRDKTKFRRNPLVVQCSTLHKSGFYEI